MASNQVILITGPSTGFGRRFAETLSRRGHTIFASMRDPGGRNAQHASELRSLAERESLHLHVLELDVTDDASVERAVRTVVDHSGGIDVAINSVVVADASRADSYGGVNQFGDKISAALAKSAGNAQDVADVVLRVIETPTGQRQLRYRISASNFGVDEINDLSASVQARFLEAFGLSADTKFVQRKTVGAA